LTVAFFCGKLESGKETPLNTMTKEEIADMAFQAGKDQDDFSGGYPKDLERFSTDEFDALEVWRENYASGEEYARHAAAETVEPEKWLHEEDYLEWRDCLEG
jgi:hypothetical protein